jgi:hypothetical protein
MGAERVEGAVRAWTSTRKPKRRDSGSPGIGDVEEPWRDPGPSEWSIVFDTETTLSIDQELRVLAYQVRQGDEVVEAGFAYNPRRLDAPDLVELERHARDAGLVVMPVRRFITDVFVNVFVDLRGLLIGFNLPWDISRIAAGHGRVAVGRGPGGRIDRSMIGGVSFSFDGTDVRVQVKRTHARGAFIRLALGTGSSPEKRNRLDGGDLEDHRGYVVDVSTIAGAMLGRKLSLAQVADTLGTEHRKLDVDLGGPIGPELLRYAMNDVWVTWDAFQDLRGRFEALALPQTPLWRVHSEASIGKAHLREMGLVPWRKAQPEVPGHLLAAILESYYGGRVECGIRSVLVPGVLLDFTAQYPTVSTLMGMWRYHIARGIEATEEPPEQIVRMLHDVSVDRVLEPGFWRGLEALLLIDPQGSSLPTRAHVGVPRSRAARRGRTDPKARHLSLPRRADHVAQWWTLADAVASVLRTGRVPRVVRVLRFRPLEPQGGLRPVQLAGLASAVVDPLRDDVIRRMVEQRKSIDRDATKAALRGDARLASELRGRALAIKKSANSIAYGVPIEENVTVMAKTSSVTVHRPNGTTFQAQGIHRTEEPGEWFHPFVATVVVAGGRLLLAMAERLIRDAGGTFAYADTDGLFAVSTQQGGRIPLHGAARRRAIVPIHALSTDEVDAIAERFGTLNPYDRSIIPGSILGRVDVGVDLETGEKQELFAYSVAGKRYALFTMTDGRPTVALDRTGKPHRSEHGLGHLLSPVGRSGGDWVGRWWEHLVRLDLGIADPRPYWFDQPAVGALTMTSFADLHTFDAFNRHRTYQRRIRPWGFVMTAHVHPLARHGHGPRVLVSPREDDPAKRLEADWFDRGSTEGAALGIRVGDPAFVLPGVITVQSYGDYFEEFRRHPEIKAAGPDGEPCHTWTIGQLSARELEVMGLVRIGKEVGRVAIDPASGEASDLLAEEYRESVCYGCSTDIPFGQKWCSEACRKRTERRRTQGERKCGSCGLRLQPPQRRWCSEACRKRAGRAPRLDPPTPGRC